MGTAYLPTMIAQKSGLIKHFKKIYFISFNKDFLKCFSSLK